MRFLLTLALIVVFAFLLGRAIDIEQANGQPQATSRSLLYPRPRPLSQMTLPQLERWQVRALASYRGALAAHEKAASRRALTSREWTHRRFYRHAVIWTADELAQTRTAIRAQRAATDWPSIQIRYATLIARTSNGDPWPNCPDPYDGSGASWQDTVNCENGGNWNDSPGFYRCGLQFDPMWETHYRRRFCP